MIKENTLRYLHIFDTNIDASLDASITSCIKEVIEIAKPHFMVKEFSLSHHPLQLEGTNLVLAYSDLEEVLEGCTSCLVVACTLGIEIDRRIRYLSISDMSKMTIFDAASSAYIEEYCDKQEETLGLERRTMRYCPGYGNVPISLNKELASLLECEKHIGLHVHNDLLLPQKSMIGIIGIGKNNTVKSCKHCLKVKDCLYLKQGKTCYRVA